MDHSYLRRSHSTPFGLAQIKTRTIAVERFLILAEKLNRASCEFDFLTF